MRHRESMLISSSVFFYNIFTFFFNLFIILSWNVCWMVKKTIFICLVFTISIWLRSCCDFYIFGYTWAFLLIILIKTIFLLVNFSFLILLILILFDNIFFIFLFWNYTLKYFFWTSHKLCILYLHYRIAANCS
jgi:hypothetical protein